MLVLGRKINESVDLAVGDVTISVMVTQCRDGKVRLGIEAPMSVRILRRELAEGRERRAESQTAARDLADVAGAA